MSEAEIQKFKLQAEMLSQRLAEISDTSFLPLHKNVKRSLINQAFCLFDGTCPNKLFYTAHARSRRRFILCLSSEGCNQKTHEKVTAKKKRLLKCLKEKTA